MAVTPDDFYALRERVVAIETSVRMIAEMAKDISEMKSDAHARTLLMQQQKENEARLADAQRASEAKAEARHRTTLTLLGLAMPAMIVLSFWMFESRVAQIMQKIMVNGGGQ